MERHCGLHSGHDGECGAEKTTSPISGRKTKIRRPTTAGLALANPGRNWTLFDLLVRTGDSDWIGGFGHDQLQHESELVGSSPPRRMQCQLQSAAGRNLHRDSTHNIGCCHWSYPFDHLRLYGGCAAQIKLVSDSLDPPA
jgi:hypothetical protein